MRESKFVEQNREKWEQFEADLKARKKDPHVLRSQMIEITDDLSYSRTFYKSRSVRIYLNGLAQKVYNNIYKNKKNFFSSLVQFYKEEVPRILYHSRKELLVSFLILLFSVLIGAFSSWKDEGFARSILGDDYVDMTLENIRSGDPLGVYKQDDQVSMFFRIMINNLRVSLFVFIAGIMASYGAIVIMIRNGIMLGVFMYFFYSRGLGTEFNLTVWMHGTIEILTLVVETVAGMLLGRGLVYPGTFSRTKAFSVWGKRGSMVFLSTVPFIVFAAFIESFLTRHTELPSVLRATLILLSLALMIFYFAWYPIRKFRGGADKDLGMPELRSEQAVDFKPDNLYSNGQILLKSIQLIGASFNGVLRRLSLVSIVYLGLLFLFLKQISIDKFKLLETDFTDVLLRTLLVNLGKFIELFRNFGLLFNRSAHPLMYVFVSVWTSVLMYYALSIFSKQLSGLKFDKRKAVLSVLTASFVLNTFMFSDSGWMVFLYILFSGPAMMMAAMSSFGIAKTGFLNAALRNMSSGATKVPAMLFTFLLTCFIGMIFIISPFSYLLTWMLEINVDLDEQTFTMAMQMLMMLAFIFLAGFCLLFYFVQIIFLSFTLHEIAHAEGIAAGIQSLGKSSKTYGMETE